MTLFLMSEISESKREDAISRVLKLLSKNVYELSDREIKELLSILPDALNEIPSVTKTNVEKLQLYKILKQILEDVEKSK